MKDIYQMAAEFRTAMLKAKANREFSGDGLIEFFPRGNCGIVCDLLGRYLLEQAGVRSWYTSGEVSSESHVWLTLENDDIVDITGAKQLLRFTDMTVDEVGAAVGMGDANYFSRMFRKVEGISPREYRKQW